MLHGVFHHRLTFSTPANRLCPASVVALVCAVVVAVARAVQASEVKLALAVVLAIAVAV